MPTTSKVTARMAPLVARHQLAVEEASFSGRALPAGDDPKPTSSLLLGQQWTAAFPHLRKAVPP